MWIDLLNHFKWYVDWTPESLYVIWGLVVWKQTEFNTTLYKTILLLLFSPLK